jgi:tRNA modification GTPase
LRTLELAIQSSPTFGHYESLYNAQKLLQDVVKGISVGISGDLLAMDIRQALHYFGKITGEITTDDLLSNIFSRFCIEE